MRTASVTRAMHPKVSSEAEVDCTRLVIAAVPAGLQPAGQTITAIGPKTGGCTILQNYAANGTIYRLFFNRNSKTTAASYGIPQILIERDRVSMVEHIATHR
jgi:hypothetical protein